MANWSKKLYSGKENRGNSLQEGKTDVRLVNVVKPDPAIFQRGKKRGGEQNEYRIAQ